NLFGSPERVLMALEAANVDEVVGRLEALVRVVGKLSLRSALRGLRALKSARPKLVRRAPCKEKVFDQQGFKLTKLPAIRSWPKEAGRFITLPLVFTRDPETGRRNVGIYRMQVFDDASAGMHWQLHKHGALHLSKSRGPLEVAVALGGDPALTLAAAMPLPEAVDEVVMAGLLKGSSMKLVKCESVDLEVPASAEIVLEGTVDPRELRVEGPFGDHTGYYTPPKPCHVFRLRCATMKEHSVFPAWVEGRPPTEGAVLQGLFQRIALPLIKALLPEVVDVNFPAEACFHGMCVVSIKKRYPGHAERVMMGLWGLEAFSLVKVIVVVDEDVDVHDLGQVLWAASTRVDPARDLLIIERAPLDELDHASPVLGLGSKLGVDATRKVEGEVDRPTPEELRVDEEVARRIDELWPKLGL
ncbi:MAG: menaquinone biosynthesis decarboxylase, partial [Thermoprotei archaeon]